jgi:hypothetical protein
MRHVSIRHRVDLEELAPCSTGRDTSHSMSKGLGTEEAKHGELHFSKFVY